MVALIAGFVLGQSQDSVKSFNVGHLSVETLVTLLRDGQPVSLVPQGVKITLDQSSNSLIARGSESKLEELGRILATFDVEPRKLKISALVTWSQLGKEWTSEATVYSGESWSMGDRESAFYLTAKPRLSGPKQSAHRLRTAPRRQHRQVPELGTPRFGDRLRRDGSLGDSESG